MEELGLIRHGAVLLRDGLVTAVGPDERICRLPAARGAKPVDAGCRVVLPGFVDSHTHALFAAPRLDEYEARIGGSTYAGLARAGGGIQASARLIRSASERSLVCRLGQVARLFLEHGTTTIEVKSGYGLELDGELKMLRAIREAAGRSPLEMVPTLLAHDVPRRFRRKRARFLRVWTRELIPLVARSGLAECCDVFCDRGYFSLRETGMVLRAAARAGLKLKVHAEQLVRSGSALLAAGLGALSADHLDHLSEADIRRLRGTPTVATLLPGTTLHLDSHPDPPARWLIDAGVPVALATNFNPGSSPTVSMQLILSLACSRLKMSPAEALTAATVNGAYALGRGSLVGSLEVGKQADLIIMDATDYREIPYYVGMNHCVTVIKRGRVVFSRGGREARG
ncbi:MAG: imidazolonepropionase [Nitrospirota bacterium]